MNVRPSRAVSFAASIPRPVRRASGATLAPRTPLNIRTAGVVLDEDTRLYARRRLGAKLAAVARRIERVTVRYEDVNGPRGGVDIVCRVKVVVSGIPSVLFEARAETVRAASDLAFDGVARAVRRALARARGHERARVAPRRAPYPPPEQGSLICRRVGRGPANLEKALERPEKSRRDVPVDTAQPGRSATDRRAGGGSTARRNTKRDTSGMTAALEDSARERPSRKSTRKSVGRAKQDAKLRRRRVREVHAPAARARRAGG